MKAEPRRRMERRLVLEEESYARCLERIIERDFFPDLKSLRSRWEWLGGETSDSLPWSERVGGSSGTVPRDWETPSEEWEGDGKTAVERRLYVENIEREIEDGKLTLESFLEKYISEDQDSFKRILDKMSRIRETRLRNRGIETQGNEQAGSISTCMPPPKSALLNHSTTMLLEHDGARRGRGLSSASRAPNDEPGIVAENTRFMGGMESSALSETSASFSALGKTPIHEYEYLTTPTIRPGQDDQEPIITWGVVDDVLQLDGQSSLGQEKRFRIPPTPSRDAVARSLSGGFHLSSKSRAKPVINRGQAHTPLSPAAKRLASRALGGTPSLLWDTQLKASYTKTPRSATPASPEYTSTRQ